MTILVLSRRTPNFRSSGTTMEAGRLPEFMIRRAIQSSCGSRRRIDGGRVAPACERTKVCA